MCIWEGHRAGELRVPLCLIQRRSKSQLCERKGRGATFENVACSAYTLLPLGGLCWVARVANDKGVALGGYSSRTALRSGGVAGGAMSRHQRCRVDHIARTQHSTQGIFSRHGGRRPRTALRNAHRGAAGRRSMCRERPNRASKHHRNRWGRPHYTTLCVR